MCRKKRKPKVDNIVPFIIEDEIKHFYYRGLSEWKNEKGYLTDTCLSAQDKFKAYLDYFKISYYASRKRPDIMSVNPAAIAMSQPCQP